ncbi:MAG: radical SAM protein [Deltaproteobacteria bacterium]|jgi:hypothetical protein
MIVYQKVCLGPEDNDHCTPCPARDEEQSYDLRGLTHQVNALADPENVELCGGESTLDQDLFSLISHARGRGARRIKLVTSGRWLANWDMLTGLTEGGCRLFEVKIHGSRPETHEAITGQRGSFDQTLQGLQNLSTLSGSGEYEGAIYVAARVGVTRANLEDLVPTIALLASLGVDRIVLARMGVDLPMKEAAQVVGNAMRVAALNRVWSVCEGFPPCLMKGSEMHVTELLQPEPSKAKKPKGCHGCTYVEICSGPPKGVAGQRAFRAVSSSPYVEDVRPLLRIRSPHGEQ